jgi:hypothetical protein
MISLSKIERALTLVGVFFSPSNRAFVPVGGESLAEIIRIAKYLCYIHPGSSF